MAKTASFHVKGMTCGGCEKAVVQAALGVAGVSQALASRAENKLTVTWAEDLAQQKGEDRTEKIRLAIEAAGFEWIG